MTALKVLIADDELLARSAAARGCSARCPTSSIVGECDRRRRGARRASSKADVDVVLLDIQMPGLTGARRAGALARADGPYVIFCTAHAEHAVAGVRRRARSTTCSSPSSRRACRRRSIAPRAARAARTQFASAAKQRQLARLAISTRQGVVLVDPARHHPRGARGRAGDGVHAATRSTSPTSRCRSCRSGCPTARFERVHRRALLNLAQVARLEPLETGGYIARTHGGHAVEVSRQAARELRKRLGLRKAAGDEEG